jgi:Osmosensitive K+ channel histidine kinase
MKLRTKLWLVLVVGAMLSMALFVITSVWIGKFVNKGYALFELNPIAQSVAASLEQLPELEPNLLKRTLDQAHEQHPDIRWLWIDEQGQTLYDTAGVQPRFTFHDMAMLIQNMPGDYVTDKDIPVITKAAVGGQSYYLLLIVPASAMKQGEVYFLVRTMNSIMTLVVPLLISFSIPFLLALWMFSSINKRIRRLNQALNQLNIHHDSPEVQLTDSSKDELGQLTLHYNSMAQRIRNQFAEIHQFENKRKLLLSNLSHDLRTPLTTILGCAEMIRIGNYQDQQELQARAKIILQRSRYMDKLLDQMLDISRQDADGFAIHQEIHNLSEIVRKLAAEYMMILDGEQIVLDVDLPDEDVHLFIDASLIERAIRNLLDNAIRYGKQGRYLGIQLTTDAPSVHLSVSDKGKGIPAEHQAHVFERFYRVEGGRQGEGLGIGLAIVKEIVEAHQGSVELHSIPDAGTTVQIALLRKPPVM